MLKTYARYRYNNDVTGRRIGGRWLLVTKEDAMWDPSGRHNTLIIGGWAVKACHCESVQVIE